MWVNKKHLFSTASMWIHEILKRLFFQPFINRVKLPGKILENGENAGIEVGRSRSAVSLDDRRQAQRMIERRFIPARSSKRVIHVGNRHDLPGQGDGIPLQAFGVARPVPAFMVGSRDLRPEGEKTILRVSLANLMKRAQADRRVGFHDLELFGAVLSRF